ncbi:hypothetical protein ACFL1B_00820 [Nanoarchaeota archaeon]
MKRGLLLVFILLIAIAGCSEKSFEDNQQAAYQPSTFMNKPVIRPAINKTELPEPVIEPELPPEMPEKVKEIEVESFNTPVSEHRMQVGYGIFSTNTTLGSPVFGKYEFPKLLKTRSVDSKVNRIRATYEHFLRLKGGKVMFTGNNLDEVSDFLVFENKEPILEYELVLSHGTFLDFVGSEIWFLGNTYKIGEANKEDLILQNTETYDILVIGAGHVRLNDEVLEDTDSRMTGSSLLLISKAEALVEGDDIFIPKGHSLQEYLGEPTLLTNKFDIRYFGVMDVPSNLVYVQNKGDEIELRMINQLGETRIPLAYKTPGGFRLGDEEGLMHVKEAENTTDFNVQQNEYFILSMSQVDATDLYYRHRDGMAEISSIVMHYKDINIHQKRIEIVSREGFALELFYNGTPGDGATGFIQLYDERYRFWVGGEETGYALAVDMNADERVSGAIVDYIMPDGIIDLPSKEVFAENGNVRLEFLNFDDVGMKKEEATMRINANDEFTLTLLIDTHILEMDDDHAMSVTEYGTHYFLFNEEGNNEYEDLTISHPLAPRLAEIVIEAY